MREVGALLDARAFHPARPAREHLRWLAASNGLPRGRVDAVLELVGLTRVARRRTGGFSLGMAQRLGIAAALLGDPPVLLFDEPVNGLDPEGIRWIRGFLRSLAAEGRAVLVSSHLMSELEDTADHLIVIGRGRLIADTTVRDLLDAAAGARFNVRTPQPAELMELLAGAGAVVTSTDHDALDRLGPRRCAHRRPGCRPRPARLRAFTAPCDARGGVHGSHPRLRRLRRGEGVVSRPGLPHAVAAEWIKLRSVRSSAWMLLAAFAFSLVGTFLICASTTTEGGSPGHPGDNDIVRDSLAGVWLGQILLAVLAVLVVTSEYSTGTIRATFAALPRRRLVLVAKSLRDRRDRARRPGS